MTAVMLAVQRGDRCGAYRLVVNTSKSDNRDPFETDRVGVVTCAKKSNSFPSFELVPYEDLEYIDVFYMGDSEPAPGRVDGVPMKPTDTPMGMLGPRERPACVYLRAIIPSASSSVPAPAFVGMAAGGVVGGAHLDSSPGSASGGGGAGSAGDKPSLIERLEPILDTLVGIFPSLCALASGVTPLQLAEAEVKAAAQSLSDDERRTFHGQTLPDGVSIHRYGRFWNVDKNLPVSQDDLVGSMSPSPLSASGGAGGSSPPPTSSSPTRAPTPSKRGISVFAFAGEHLASMSSAVHGLARHKIVGSSGWPCLVASYAKRRNLPLKFTVDQKGWVVDSFGNRLVAHILVSPSRPMQVTEFIGHLETLFSDSCLPPVLRASGSRPASPRTPDKDMVKPVACRPPSTGDPKGSSPESSSLPRVKFSAFSPCKAKETF